MSKVKTFEMKGFIVKDTYSDNGGPFLVSKKDEKPGLYDIGEMIQKHFTSLYQTNVVDFGDWESGDYMEYKDVFVQYFIAEEESTWEELTEEQIKTQAGALITHAKYDGYSEYTITDEWTDVFVGGHDLRKEIFSKIGKFAIIRINYKNQ